MLLTVDSSIFVASLRPTESHHTVSSRLVDLIESGIHEVVVPTTVLIEVVASVRRRTGSELLARRAERYLRDFRTITFEPLSRVRTLAALRVASALALRGMDAIVVQVAEEFGATLVTLDEEMARRASGLVSVRDVASL